MRHRQAWISNGIGTCPIVETATRRAQRVMNPMAEFWADALEFGNDVPGDRYRMTTADALALPNELSYDGKVHDPANIRALFVAYIKSVGGVESKQAKIGGVKCQIWSGVRIRTD